MRRVLVLFAHPALEKSRIHRRLLRAVPQLPGITVHDLYEEYPSFNISVAREQRLLLEHDLVILQHPLYWYSTPAILKQWMDLVLEHGWAYGSQGTKLEGKRVMALITAGGGADAYTREGYNGRTIRELFAPIERTFTLCRMAYVPPWVIFGAHRMDDQHIAQAAERYRQLLTWLHDDRLDLDAARGYGTLNEALDHGVISEVPL